MHVRSRWLYPLSGLALACSVVMITSFVGCDSSKTTKDTVPTSSTPATWLESFDDAKKLAEESGKPILADFTGSDWCYWCKRLKDEVFDTPEFNAWAADNVVLLEIDFPQARVMDPVIVEQNNQMQARYAEYVPGYPTVLFLTADGEVIEVLGYLEGGPENWITEASKKISS